jgi:hypothetical protein
LPQHNGRFGTVTATFSQHERKRVFSFVITSNPAGGWRKSGTFKRPAYPLVRVLHRPAVRAKNRHKFNFVMIGKENENYS